MSTKPTNVPAPREGAAEAWAEIARLNAEPLSPSAQELLNDWEASVSRRPRVREPSAEVAPDGAHEALQRLIENGLAAGLASREDAMLVARFRRPLMDAAAQVREQAAQPSLYLTAGQLRDALQFAGDDPETDIVLTKREAFTSDEGEAMEAGIYAHLGDYPEDGVYGPLDNAEPPAEPSPMQAQDERKRS